MLIASRRSDNLARRLQTRLSRTTNCHNHASPSSSTRRERMYSLGFSRCIRKACFFASTTIPRRWFASPTVRGYSLIWKQAKSPQPLIASFNHWATKRMNSLSKCLVAPFTHSKNDESRKAPMVDTVDAATRSRMMAGIKSRNTKPETTIRKGLHACGFRYRLSTKGVPGKPDLVLPKWRTVVLVHGCFWHRHDCALSKLPTSNVQFWQTKLAATKRRDDEVKTLLAADGWRVAVVWECATRGKYAQDRLPWVLDTLARWIRKPGKSSTLEIGVINLPVRLTTVARSTARK